jgi:signal transduction histidine kinase
MDGVDGVDGAAVDRRRWWRSRSVWDGLGVATATALILLGSLGESYPTNPSDMLPPGATPPPWPAYLIVTAAGISLAWRRRWPIGIWAFTVVTVSVYSMLGYVYGAALIAPTIALYEAVSLGRARRAIVLGAVSTVVLMLVGGVFGPFSPLGGPVEVVPFEMLVAVGMGLATANRRKYVAEIQDRAERAERTRDEEARRRVDTERLRIARELHDVVAHTMATINVQAAAAAHVLVDPPPQAAEAIAAIRSASKEGLRELRAILNLLRQADDQDSVQPTPGLGQLDVLVGTVRRAGLATEVRVAGELPRLPPAVDVAAYRIIQESLTNVLRHAGPATATVELAVRDGRLCVHVGDDGVGGVPRQRGAPTGHGLIGMRERAASVGGTLEAGPGPGGGFAVRATLPVEVRQQTVREEAVTP